MKGFVKVDRALVEKALAEREKAMELGRQKLAEAQHRFAEMKREGFWGFRWRNKTDARVTAAYVPSFGNWSEVLFCVCTSEDLKAIQKLEDDVWYSGENELEALLDAESGGGLMLGEYLCQFIKRWTKDQDNE